MVPFTRFGFAVLLATGLGGAGCDSTPEIPGSVAVRVEVLPAAVDLEPGETSQLAARVFDDSSNLLNKAVSWRSADPGVATVGPGGLVSAVAEGTTTVRAEVDGRFGSAAVQVSEPSGPAVVTVDVAPATPALTVGQSITLAVTPRDATGAIVTGLAVTWMADDPGVAAVSDAGVVTGVAVGSTRVTATVQGVQGSATVTVTAPQSADGIVDIDPTRSYQTMVGWEGSAQMGQIECGSGYESWKNELADRLVNELGINRVRMPLRSGLENSVNWFAQYVADPGDRSFRNFWYSPVNDNDDPNVTNLAGFFLDEIDHQIQTVIQPLRDAMTARGEELYVNLCFVDFGASFYRGEPEEYAEVVALVFDHIRQTYGWSPDALEVMLEPDLGSAQWLPHQVADALAAAGRRLEAKGFTPEFVAPSVTNMANAVPWLNAIAQNPDALRYLDEFSYHRYQGASTQEAAAIANRAGQLGLRTAMLEHIGADLDELWEDLTVADNSSWQQFALAYCSENGQASYYRIVNGEVSLREMNRPLLQIFPFVRRGAVRHGTTVRDASLRAMAFRNADGRWAVIVETQGPKAFTVGHLPPGTYAISYTGADGATASSLGTVTVVGGEVVPVQMPAAGVITVYGG